jgi:hypothetical protein
VLGTQRDHFSQAGFLDATLSFPDPVNLFWTNVPDKPDVLLATVNLPDMSVSGAAPKSGVLELQNVKVSIVDVEAMGRFSSFLIKGDSFSWRLSGNAAAKAYGLTFGGL